MIRFAGGLMREGASSAVPDSWSRCPHCREEFRLLAEAHEAAGQGQPAPADNAFYRHAVQSLARLHRTDGFRKALLPGGSPAVHSFQPAFRYALAAAAAILLLVVPVLILVQEKDGAPVRTAARPAAIRTLPATPPAPAPSVMAEQPAAAAPVARVAAVPAQRTRPRTHNAPGRPAPAPEPSRLAAVDSSQMVVMIHYLSGNISDGGAPYSDMNDDGRSGAVDLAMMLNLSVQNISPAGEPHS
jgi:hypothetical protein